MAPGEIDHVDEVSNSCPIRSVPVSTKNIQDRLGASKDSSDDWDQVAGFLSRIFAQDSGFMAAHLVHQVSHKSTFEREYHILG